MAHTTTDTSTASAVSTRRRTLVSVFVASCFAVGVIVGLSSPVGITGGVRGAGSREDADDSVPVRKTYGTTAERNLKGETNWEDDRANQKDFYGAWEPDRKAKKNEYRHESEEEWAMKVPPQLRAARAELFEVEDSLTGLSELDGTSFSFDFDTFDTTELEEVHTPSKLETLRNVLLQNKLKANRDMQGLAAWKGAADVPEWNPSALTKWDLEFEDDATSFSFYFTSSS